MLVVVFYVEFRNESECSRCKQSAIVGVSSRMLSAHTNLIECEGGTFPNKESQLLVLSKHRTCVSFILISGLWTKKSGEKNTSSISIPTQKGRLLLAL